MTSSVRGCSFLYIPEKSVIMSEAFLVGVSIFASMLLHMSFPNMTII